MIGILGGMGTQAGLDFCNKLAIQYRGKIDQDYPLFFLYNKSNIPGRPESIGKTTGALSNRFENISSKKHDEHPHLSQDRPGTAPDPDRLRATDKTSNPRSECATPPEHDPHKYQPPPCSWK